MATVAALQQRLRGLLHDPDAIFWEDAELLANLNEAQDVLGERTRFLTQTVYLPRREGTWCYDIAGVLPNLIAPYRIWLPDVHRRLEAVSLTHLDILHPLWQTITGDPWYWAALDWRQFVLYPVPAEGHGMMEIACYVWPDPLTAATQIPRWHLAAEEALTLYAEALGHLKQWDAANATMRLEAFMARYMRVRGQAAGRQFQGHSFVRGTPRGW